MVLGGERTPAGSFFNDAAEFLLPNSNAIVATWLPIQSAIIGSVLFTFRISLFFTYFWTAIQYNVEDISNNLKAGWVVYSGCAARKQTRDFLDGVISRVTVVGAAFIAAVAPPPAVHRTDHRPGPRAVREHHRRYVSAHHGQRGVGDDAPDRGEPADEAVRILRLEGEGLRLRTKGRDMWGQLRSRQPLALKPQPAPSASSSSAPPGVGKGTQSALLVQRLGLKALSSGDIFRKEIEAETDPGRMAQQYISHGDLVPNGVTIEMMAKRLRDDDVRRKGFVLDGFPRTLRQAEALTEILDQMEMPLSRAVSIELPDEVVLHRLTGAYGLHQVRRDLQQPQQAAEARGPVRQVQLAPLRAD